MKRERLKQIVADQIEYTPPRTFFERSQTSQIQKFADDPSIIIVSGIRRCGKSTIQRLFQKSLLKSDYFFNFDDERLVQFEVDDFQTWNFDTPCLDQTCKY